MNPHPQPRPRTRWSWLSFGVGTGAGVILGMVGLMLLGMILFEDDVSAALDEDRGSGNDPHSVVADAAELLTKCEGTGMVAQMCLVRNKPLVERIAEESRNLPTTHDSASLSSTADSWLDSREEWLRSGCGSDDPDPLLCPLPLMSMNLDVSTMQAVSEKLVAGQ